MSYIKWTLKQLSYMLKKMNDETKKFTREELEFILKIE